MPKFKTAMPMMYVGGPQRLHSGEDGIAESEDPAQVAYMREHPYCEEVKDGTPDKGRPGGKKGSDRPATGEAD